jgi:hypothetical protein
VEKCRPPHPTLWRGSVACKERERERKREREREREREEKR